MEATDDLVRSRASFKAWSTTWEVSLNRASSAETDWECFEQLPETGFQLVHGFHWGPLPLQDQYMDCRLGALGKLDICCASTHGY